MDKNGGYMLFSGYTISDIAFTALIPLCILLAFTIIMMLANTERDEEDKYIMWEKIQMVVGIFFSVDVIYLIVLYHYSPELFYPF